MTIHASDESAHDPPLLPSVTTAVAPADLAADQVYVDTHAHLDEAAFAGDLADVVRRAAAAGVTRIVNIGFRPLRWTTTIELAKRFSGISVVLGLHPQHAGEFDDQTCDHLAALIQASEARAVGEIGLDYARDFATPEQQRRAFAAQLELAVDLRLPIVIHQRDAAEDCRDMLRAVRPDHPVVLHCFDGSPALARLGLERGYYFGIGGLLTKAASDHLRSVATTLPIERLVLETDAPYLTPAAVKARRNEPANIPRIADQLAAIHRVTREDIARVTTHNAERVFALSTDSLNPV